jgi:hypothetical protein
VGCGVFASCPADFDCTAWPPQPESESPGRPGLWSRSRSSSRRSTPGAGGLAARTRRINKTQRKINKYFYHLLPTLLFIYFLQKLFDMIFGNFFCSVFELSSLRKTPKCDITKKVEEKLTSKSLLIFRHGLFTKIF